MSMHSKPKTLGLLLHPNDNVAILLQDAAPGPVELIGSGDGVSITAAEPISNGHKVALREIAEGQPVIKYGVTIGLASEPIAAGAWVHTHNCRSRIDQRSHTLDRHTGAPTDTQYE